MWRLIALLIASQPAKEMLTANKKHTEKELKGALVVSCNGRGSLSFLLGFASCSSYLTLLLLVNPVPALELLGVVEALHVVFAEEDAVAGLAAAAHALAEVHPEVVAPPLVPVDSPAGRHRRALSTKYLATAPIKDIIELNNVRTYCFPT